MTDDATHPPGPTQVSGLGLDPTLVAPPSGMPPFAPTLPAARVTVLPRVRSDGVVLSLTSRSRYEHTKLLGAGGMGEVVLVTDHDIDRKVALKRLLPEVTDPGSLARFIDEIRTVGRLEHPNIVPIHDVGVDQEGRYFFVMKYVEGETLESIIAKLAAGDPAYLAKYSIEVRLELFVGLLHALEYAHSQGVVHRDVKPANVMVGHYGEVVLMDWGIAKPIASPRDASRSLGEVAVRDESPRARIYATHVGSLIGTPAYMSPEQARGDNDKIDVRSDLYSATVVFHELLGFEHYLSDKQDTDSVLEAIKSEPVGFLKLLGLSRPPPAELLHFIVKGLKKDPDKRFQNAAEPIADLHAMLEGKVAVHCHITFTKRIFRELGRLVDRAPMLGFALLLGFFAALVFAAFQLVRLTLA